jgi:hypothetical protein
VLANPVPIGTSGFLTAQADDSLTGNSRINSAVYNIDGGATWSPMTAADGAFTTSVEGLKGTIPAFSAAGVHTICVKASDSANNESAGTACAMFAVYDPTAGFVTGGGWINSPAGAYMFDPTLQGRANFGFVSKYKKGQTVPDGETEFQFQAAGLNFHSESYSWLVVAGTRAQFKGTGQINGSGSYNFLLTAIDGDLANPKTVDKFRIKIMNRNPDGTDASTVYDNDAKDEGTPLGGGSVQIQDPKK